MICPAPCRKKIINEFFLCPTFLVPPRKLQELIYNFFLVLQAVVDIMKILPVNQYASLVEWINMYSKNDKVLIRDLYATD